MMNSHNKFKLGIHNVKDFIALKPFKYTCICGNMKGTINYRITVNIVCSRCKYDENIKTHNGNINQSYRLTRRNG